MLRRLRSLFQYGRSPEAPSHSSLIDIRAGKMWLVPQPREGPAGPINEITFYGDLRHMQGEIPVPKRYDGYRLNEGGSHVGAKLPGVTDAMHEITRLVARV